MPVSPPHFAQPEVWGAGAVPIAAPLCVCMHCACVHRPHPGICLLSQSHQPEPHVTCLVLSAGERCHPEAGQGDVFPCSHCFQKRRRGWPFPRGQLVAVRQPGLTQAGLCMTPKWGEEGCCHGGLCRGKFLQGEVGMLYPGSGRERASGRGQRAGLCTDTVRPWCAGRWPWAFPGCLVPGSVCLSTWVGVRHLLSLPG